MDSFGDYKLFSVPFHDAKRTSSALKGFRNGSGMGPNACNIFGVSPGKHLGRDSHQSILQRSVVQ
jgi:hypothetical protein